MKCKRSEAPLDSVVAKVWSNEIDFLSAGASLEIRSESVPVKATIRQSSSRYVCASHIAFKRCRDIACSY